MLYNYIAELDLVCPNGIDYETKCKWLDRLEAMLCEQLEDRLPEGRDLIAEHPYDEIYVIYLKMKCAEAVGDTERYNNYLKQFNDARDSLYGYYIRKYPSRKKVGWKNVL